MMREEGFVKLMILKGGEIQHLVQDSAEVWTSKGRKPLGSDFHGLWYQKVTNVKSLFIGIQFEREWLIHSGGRPVGRLVWRDERGGNTRRDQR